MAKEYKRLGSQEKCPACGWRLDPDAYRCPKCMIYFCFKCRRRVMAKDPQFQCLNQQCQYYGKLLCEVCTTAVPEYSVITEQVPHYNHTEGLGKWIVGGGVVLGIAVWIFLSFSVGFWVALASIIIGTIVAAVKGKPLFDQDETTYTTRSEQYQSGYHRECIACHQPVEVLHD